MELAVELAKEVAARLGEVDGVAAVALGGSWARGEARQDSDVDLGLYYDPASPFRIQELRELARELDDRHQADAVTGFGEWGLWINGGGWLRIEGRRIDWLYRDLALVRHTIDDCRGGRPALYHQPGHPHGFHTHIYAGEIHYAQALHDPGNILGELKLLTDPYPPLLRRAIVRVQLWQAGFALDTTRSSAERGDVFHAAGSLFQCVANLVQVLYALNERYLINEKGALAGVGALPVRPKDFVETASAVLSCAGRNPSELRETLERLDGETEEVRDLCSGILGDHLPQRVSLA